MLRFFIIIGLAAGIFIGMKAERYLQTDRCLDAGGTVNTSGLCIGARANK